jgi:ribosomal protein L21E
MQKHELRQIIREEISKVIKEASENVSDYNQTAQDTLKNGDFTLITPETSVKVGAAVISKYNGLFGVIKRISGDTYFITYDIDDYDEAPIKRVRKNLEKQFLIRKRK